MTPPTPPATSTTTLYLVRHAEQDRTVEETPGAGLSALGERQAELLGNRLRAVPFTAIEHSPLRRAAQTAELVGRSLPGVPIHSSELLRDRTPVPVPGREDEYPADRQGWFADVPTAERDEGGTAISAAIEHFSGRTSNGDPASSAEAAGSAGAESIRLLVTHGFVLGWFVRQALDAPVWRWMGLNSANTGLTIIRYGRDRPTTLTCFNDVGHLTDLS